MTTSTEKITVVHVEDHVGFQDMVKLVFTHLAPDISVIDTALTGPEGVEKILRLRPTVAIVDMLLKPENAEDPMGYSGNKVIEAVLAKWPLARILVCTNEDLYVYTAFPLVRAFKLGVAGILFKSESADELVSTIRQVAAGGRNFPKKVARHLDEEYWRHLDIQHTITAFEQECGAYLAYGYPDKMIANALNRTHTGISSQNVRSHLHNLYQKLGTNNRVESALFIQQLQFLGQWPSPPSLDDEDLTNGFEENLRSG